MSISSQDSVIGTMIAKGESIRLPGKNRLDFHGQPMFEVNLVKLLRACTVVFFDSDDAAMRARARELGARDVIRPEALCGHDIPSVPLLKNIVTQHAADLPWTAVLNIQANSPNIQLETVYKAAALMASGAVQEMQTASPQATLHGSVWGFSRERLLNYGDPYTIRPEVLLADDAVDIHTYEEYEEALKHQPAPAPYFLYQPRRPHAKTS